MYKITNLINSPYTVETTNGKATIPALGSITVKLAESMATILKASTIVEIKPVKQEKAK